MPSPEELPRLLCLRPRGLVVPLPRALAGGDGSITAELPAAEDAAPSQAWIELSGELPLLKLPPVWPPV